MDTNLQEMLHQITESYLTRRAALLEGLIADFLLRHRDQELGDFRLIEQRSGDGMTTRWWLEPMHGRDE